MKERFMSKVFLWMFFGLLVTFVTGVFTATNETMLINIFNGWGFWVLLLLEFGLVLVLSAKVMDFQPSTAKVLFLLYAFVSGLTFSSIFIVYDVISIIFVFLISAVIFAIFGLIGYFTNLDLTKLGTYLYMGLLGIVICYIVNIFLGNGTFDLILSIIGVLLFIGITAYDVQKIKFLKDSGLPENNLQIYGALQLYLDFINIFLDLLRIFGNSRD